MESGPWAHFLVLPYEVRRISMTATVDKEALLTLLNGPVEGLGYELVDLDVSVGGKGVLRVYIDLPGGINLGDCQRVSRALSTFLDVEDPIPGSYSLEVSSPGVDRRLRTAEHFRRFTGHEVKLELKVPRDGRRRLRGELTEAAAGAITVDVEGARWQVSMDDIEIAKLVADVRP
jgi:ribosome maturation factor RimP